MIINSNNSATNSTRLLSTSSAMLSKSLARLSSGSKIISPEDDAAGLAQSIKFDAQINRNKAANINVANAISFSQTQDGFLQKVQKALDRMSEITILAQDKTKTTTDLSNYTAEFTQLQNYISDITTKSFNSVSLFGNSATGLAITIDSDASTFTMNGAALTGALTTGGGLNASGDATDAISAIYDSSAGVSVAVSSATSAASALSYIKTAIQNLANMRAKVGANIQRLTLTSEQIDILNENLSAANSRIKDVDVAEESTQFAKYNILVQSGTTMLAQANALPQSALRLLG
jgi:flagellin